MEQILSYLNNPIILITVLIVGFVILILGADWLVDGASGLAKRFGISDLVIGMTVVAFGTSMPEFVVNMVSVAGGNTDLAITNILGSNIINIFVILGLTALVYPISSEKSTRDFDIPMTIIAGLVIFGSIFFDRFFSVDTHFQGISRWGGALLTLLFIPFLWHTIKNSQSSETEQESFKPMAVWKAVLLILVGLVSLALGSEMIVKSAVKIASDLGVSEAIIGLTIVGLGTSLPELAASVMAAFKKNSDLALGNVIGSVCFNAFLILGVSALICPLPSYEGLELDALMATGGGALCWLFVKTNDRREIKRWEGAIFILLYAAYLTYRLMSL